MTKANAANTTQMVNVLNTISHSSSTGNHLSTRKHDSNLGAMRVPMDWLCNNKLSQHRDQLERIARELLKRETLDAAAFHALLNDLPLAEVGRSEDSPSGT